MNNLNRKVNVSKKSVNKIVSINDSVFVLNFTNATDFPSAHEFKGLSVCHSCRQEKHKIFEV